MPRKRPESTLQQLKRVTNSYEAYEVRRYELMRHHPAGRVQSVTVSVCIADPGPKPRYYVYATDDQNHRVGGNHDEDLERAIAAVRWSELNT